METCGTPLIIQRNSEKEPFKVTLWDLFLSRILIQYNTIITWSSAPLSSHHYSSLAASLNKKRGNSRNYIVQTSNLETKFLIYLDQVGKLLRRAQSSAGIWRMQVECWDVLVPVPGSSKILVRRQWNYEGPFAQSVSMEQLNHHEQQIAGDNCMDRHWPVQACRTNTMEPDHANTCKPTVRARTGFFDEWDASVVFTYVNRNWIKLPLSQNPTSRRAQDRLKPVHQFVTNSSEQAVTIIKPARYKCMDQHHADVSW